MSASPPQDFLIQVLQTLNLGTLIPSALTLALMWKLYGFFNDLSEKLTRIEGKIDSLEKILPYKIKECVDQSEKTADEIKHAKHNPNIEWTDWVEVIGVAFGLTDFVIFFAVAFQIAPTIRALVLLLFVISGAFGFAPVLISKKRKKARALLSLISLVPWVYIVLLAFNLIPPII